MSQSHHQTLPEEEMARAWVEYPSPPSSSSSIHAGVAMMDRLRECQQDRDRLARRNNNDPESWYYGKTVAEAAFWTLVVAALYFLFFTACDVID
eukprot:Nk52_evm46s2039 gene=Nk52_evmTU46s2039